MDLSLSSNTLEIWTCADSLISLRDLLLYICSNGDYAAQEGAYNPNLDNIPLSSISNSIGAQDSNYQQVSVQ